MTTRSASALRGGHPVILSTIWIFVVLNYLYCDVMSLMDSNLLRQYLSGTVDGMVITPSFLLIAAILMEISMSMVLVSRLAPRGPNRIANLVAATITTVVQAATLLSPCAPYYLFCSAIEIAGTIAVFVIALTWKRDCGA
jgi:hypothetical protein